MSKTKPYTDKAKDLKEFIWLTWEVVRQNSEYRENYNRFLQNYNLTPEDVKPKKREDGSSIIPWHPARQRVAKFDFEKGRSVWEDEAPDPQRCNLSFMLHRWGFACDPDEPIPQGPSWRSAFISKEWLNKRRKSGPFWQPLMNEKIELQKLPGILEVNRWPEVWLNDENKRKFQEASRAIMDGWKPQNEQELQEYQEAINPHQWETESPPQLTITVNLQAPSYLILDALEFMIKVCKAELGISDDKIDSDMICKCLAAWKLKQKGASDKQISNKIPVRRYKLQEERRHKTPEQMKADHEMDSDTYYNVRRIKDYIEKAEAMIKKGAVI
jgi:hypothetical protein